MTDAEEFKRKQEGYETEEEDAEEQVAEAEDKTKEGEKSESRDDERNEASQAGGWVIQLARPALWEALPPHIHLLTHSTSHRHGRRRRG